VALPNMTEHCQYLRSLSRVKKAKSQYDEQYTRADIRIHFGFVSTTSFAKFVGNFRILCVEKMDVLIIFRERCAYYFEIF